MAISTSPHLALIDDDASVRKALARLLVACSFDISTYASAHEFLASLDGHRPDCLILDLHMPELTGLELQRHLNNIGVKIPTIVITGHADPELREQCITEGAAAYLLKPVNGPTLIELIKATTARAVAQ